MSPVMETAESTPILHRSLLHLHFSDKTALCRGLAGIVPDLNFFAETLMHVHTRREILYQIIMCSSRNHSLTLLPRDLLQVKRDNLRRVPVQAGGELSRRRDETASGALKKRMPTRFTGYLQAKNKNHLSLKSRLGFVRLEKPSVKKRTY